MKIQWTNSMTKKALTYIVSGAGIILAYFLMKNGDAMSFNLASLMKTYFALNELKGTFSLSLKPFELARIESSFEAFRNAMSY